MGKFYSNQPNQNIIMQRKLEKICGLSDEQILREFEKAQKNTCPLPIKPPPADEFERICRRVEAERRKILTAPQRVKWKRVAAVGLLAAALTGSGCFVALGKKSYFYREREMGGVKVFENDSSMLKVDSEEEAYRSIEEKLKIKTIRFGYKPHKMFLEDTVIDDGMAKMRFTLQNKNIFLIQSKYEIKVSFNHKSDFEDADVVENRWLGEKLQVYSEKLSNETTRYETTFILDGVYYRLTATIDKEEFLKIAQNLMH